jgi:hypothetical protein
MSQTVLDRAPPKAATARPQPPPAPRRRRDPEWILPVALAVSAVLHMAILAGIRFSITFGVAPTSVQPAVTRPAGTEIVRIVPLPEGVEAERALPEPEDPVVPPTMTFPAVIPLPAQPAAATVEVPPIADRIRPRDLDPRLWTEPEPGLPPIPTNAEIARGRLYARLGVWNDSILMATEAAARATDWTATDANGDKWGVSPGKLHLGPVTLPLPISFSPPPGRRDEFAGRVRTWTETESQVGRAIVRDDFKSQVKAIRERRDAQRDSARRARGGG